MDFWGIDRSKCSVRLKALQKIGALDVVEPQGDLDKLSAVFKESAGDVPLYPRELEVLLALVDSVPKTPHPEKLKHLEPLFKSFLMRMPRLEILPGPAVRRIQGSSPWTRLARGLVQSLHVLQSSTDIVAEFLARMKSDWTEGQQTDGQFLIWVFTLHGFLEGFAAQPLRSIEPAKGVFSWIMEFLTPETISEISTRLDATEMKLNEDSSAVDVVPGYFLTHLAEDDPEYPGASQLRLHVSRFFAELAIFASGGEKSGVPAVDGTLLSDLAKTSVSFLKEFVENNNIVAVAPHFGPLVSRCIQYIHRVIALSVARGSFDSSEAFQIALGGMELDQSLSDDQTEFEPLRLALACCHIDSSRLATLVKALPVYFGSLSPRLACKAAQLYAESVRNLPQAWLISAVYAMGNSLGPEDLDRGGGPHSPVASVLSGLVGMVIAQSDLQVRALALSILSQKYGTVDEIVDIEVLIAVAKLGPHLPERDFETALFLIDRATARHSKDVSKWLDTVRRARIIIASALPPSHPSFKTYLEHLLNLMIAVGEVNTPLTAAYSAANAALSTTTLAIPLSRHTTRRSDRADGEPKERDLREHRRSVVSPHLTPAQQIVELLEPLAALLPPKTDPPLEVTEWSLVSRFRDAWFNMAVLGYSADTKWTDDQRRYLEVIAWSTPPLVTDTSANNVESDLDLNPVLRRGAKNGHANGKQHRVVSGLFKATSGIELKPPYVRVMFLATSNMVERFRARAGAISQCLLYFGDPELRDGEGFKNMYSIASGCANAYLGDVKTGRKGIAFGLNAASQELKKILVLCCHRVGTIRDVAFDMADLFISRLPAALCTQTAMFTLLDLLTLMWQSCDNAAKDEYEPRHTFVGEKSGVTVSLGDSYTIRRQTLDRLLENARKWTAQIMTTMELDVKAILGFYLEDGDKQSEEPMALGRSFALRLGGVVTQSVYLFDKSPQSQAELIDGVSGFLSTYLTVSALRLQTRQHNSRVPYEEVRAEFDRLLALKNPKPDSVSLNEIRTLYMNTSAFLVDCSPRAMELAKDVVHLPFRFFDGKVMNYCISYWLWMVNQTPSLRLIVLQAVAEHWSRSIARKIGLFSRKHDQCEPMVAHMEYTPSNKRATTFEIRQIERLYAPHVQLINFLISMTHSSLLISEEYVNVLARIIADAMYGLAHYASLHALARGPRLALVRLAMDFIVPYSHRAPTVALGLRSLVIRGVLAWFKQPVQWPFGGNAVQLRQDIALIQSVVERGRKVPVTAASEICFGLLADELNKLQVWNDPLGTNKNAGSLKTHVTASDVVKAWSVDPQIAVALVSRRCDASAEKKLVELIEANPLAVCEIGSSLPYMLQGSPKSPRSWQVIYWTPVSEIMCINLFSPVYGGGPYLLQYSVRALESHPVTNCFFYVPQIVQALRHDSGGFVAEYILEAAKFSQLFAHQIIWNILANSYKDDDGEVPDSIKPIADKVLNQMIADFTDEERKFYETEFSFFNEITSISGKLKPYIKKSKAEKKAKIDEEMAQIVLPENVYLPSNPHGTVVDIDRESGRPLQSHAKAPFLAKFKIRRDEIVQDDDSTDEEQHTKTVEVWQGGIFKVGDDCRQDVLVLQIISVFRSIFAYSGLDLYVFPYKVTATAPGCGVIDVLPNSTSRDMLGREAVNGLYEWYISKHGNEDSINFQRARNNFVKSLAAYSVISYLLQFKDRHNGNIMYDDEGHVIHIDFGFCFEIVPGGVKFEAVPFKLTKEMVAVMGGNTHTQAYRWFEELCVKAFLSSRVYAEDICRMVAPMLESGLPCFKGDTIKKLRNRFVLNKTEREAANYMRGLISRSYESTFTKGYDEFQRLTNGIPY